MIVKTTTSDLLYSFAFLIFLLLFLSFSCINMEESHFFSLQGTFSEDMSEKKFSKIKNTILRNSRSLFMFSGTHISFNLLITIHYVFLGFIFKYLFIFNPDISVGELFQYSFKRQDFTLLPENKQTRKDNNSNKIPTFSCRRILVYIV